MPSSRSHADLAPLSPPLPLEQPPARAYSRVRAAIAREPASRRSSPRSSRALIALTLATLAALALDSVWRQRSLVRADLFGVLAVCLPSLVLGAALAFVATRLALARGKSGLGAPVSWLRAAAVGVLPATLLPMLLLTHVHADGALAESRMALDTWGMPCFVLASAIAALYLRVFVRGLRGSVAVASGWRSAALGAAAASWSGLALLIHCPGVDPRHLMVGHMLPVVLLPWLGALLLRRHVQI